MKKLFFGLALFVASSLVYSCTSDETEYIEPITTIDAGHLDVIAKLGFDINDVEDMGDFYLVEGDIALEKADIPDYAADITTRQYQYRRILDPSTVRNIKYNIASDVPQGWVDGINNAIEVWNKIPGNPVQFNLNNNPHFTIGMDWNQPLDGTIAYAQLPTGGAKPGTYVKISPHYEYRDHYFKTRVIAHELGHIIGLVHSDWPDHKGDTEGDLILGSLPRDNYSLMNHYYQETGFIFSYYDLYSIKRLWESMSLEPILITVSSDRPDEDVTVKFNGRVPTSGIDWRFEGGARLIRTVNAAEIVVNFPQASTSYGIHALGKSLYSQWIPLSYYRHYTMNPAYRIIPEGNVRVNQETPIEFRFTGPPTSDERPWRIAYIETVAPNSDYHYRIVSQDAQSIKLVFYNAYPPIDFPNPLPIEAKFQVVYVYDGIFYRQDVTVDSRWLYRG